jgi:hypothetical protein
VTELISSGKSQYDIELARKKLRVYELARFKQFRKTMLEKLRPKVSVHQKEQRKQQVKPTTESAKATSTESVDLNIDVQVAHILLKQNIFHFLA